MSNSPLVTYTKLSPHYDSRDGKKITNITIHHMAANITVQQCGEIFQTREASSNYGIDGRGQVGLYVDEKNASWANGNLDSNQRSITIELANDGAAPNWHVSDTAINKCIDLCVDICKRNGISKINFTGNKKGNLTMHKYYMATSCPGPYLESKFPYIANEINKKLIGGWIKDGNNWYYFENGAKVRNEWRQDSTKKWFYLGADGVMVKNKWVYWRDHWYYLGDDGAMYANEWAKDSKGWCYLDADGKQAKNAWIRYKNNFYYIKPDGYMCTGDYTAPCKFDAGGKLEATI